MLLSNTIKRAHVNNKFLIVDYVSPITHKHITIKLELDSNNIRTDKPAIISDHIVEGNITYGRQISGK